MKKVSYFGLLQESSKEGGQQHQMKTLDPDHITRLKELNHFVTENSVNRTVCEP